MGAEARGQLGRWFRFSDEQIETFAARKLRKMLCVARLESARLPGRQYVREEWVRQQLQGLGLPMSEASSNGLASWLTTKINDSDPQATLACTAWAYLAGR